MTTTPSQRGPDDAPSVNLGFRLRAARREAGLSLRELGARLGISPSFLSQMENGKSQPSVATLYSLAQVLDVSIDALFEAAPADTVPDTTAIRGTTAVEREPLAEDVVPPPRLHEGMPIPDDPVPVSRSDLGSLNEVWSAGSSQSRLCVTTPANRTRLVMDSGVMWDQLAKNTAPDIDFMEITYPPGSSSTPDERLLRHDGFEYGYVTEGELEVTLGFDVFTLTAGHAIGLDSSIPHLFRNQGTVPARGIWFVHHNEQVQIK